MVELTTLVQHWPDDRDWLFVDEATVRRHQTLLAEWCPLDDVLAVPTGDDHK